MDSQLSDFDKQMSAIAFAEAGEHETARRMLNSATPQPSQKQSRAEAKKPYGGAIIFGIISITAYVLLLANQKWITHIYTMGGWHTVFPVGTAFLFSFVHGAFASNLLSVLGIEAKK